MAQLQLRDADPGVDLGGLAPEAFGLLEMLLRLGESTPRQFEFPVRVSSSRGSRSGKRCEEWKAGAPERNRRDEKRP